MAAGVYLFVMEQEEEEVAKSMITTRFDTCSFSILVTWHQ